MKTNITFNKESDTYISVLLNGRVVGHIFSETSNGGLPYPHDESEKVKSTIQICGFDFASEVWSCGIFHGKKDLCLNFVNDQDDFMKNEKKEYQRYLREFINSNKDVSQLKSFQDWVKHMHHPYISLLK